MSEELEARTDEDIEVLTAAYNLLLPCLINQCQGADPRVAIAALVSAAATVCVETITDKDQSKNYFAMCTSDAFDKFDAAYERKEKLDG